MPLRILNIGDSVSCGGHRRQLQNRMEQMGFTRYDFVGDVPAAGVPTDVNHQAFGGARYVHNLSGRWVTHGTNQMWEAGLVEALPKYSPDVILLLGGYNNVVGESVGGGMAVSKSEFTNLVEYIWANKPDVRVFISTITDFDPAGTWGSKRQNVIEFNDFIRLQVEQWRISGRRICLVDVFPLVSYADLMPDGLHVAGSGHVKIGDSWFAAFLREGIVPLCRVESLRWRPTGSGCEMELSWRTQSNATYAVFAAANLLGSYMCIASNLPATPPMNAFRRVVTSPQEFYLVQEFP